MATKGNGSIILKILVGVLAFVLYQVLTIPGQIWSEENEVTEVSRANMNSVYEAQRYFYSKNNRYVHADSMEQLVAFLNQEQGLKSRRQAGVLTNKLNDAIRGVLAIPTLQSILPVSQSLYEINGDLIFNTRYFQKYDNIISQKETLSENLAQFDNSLDFPVFNDVKLYVDSLNTLSDRINEYTISESATMAKRYVDTLGTMMNGIERDKVSSFWNDQYNAIGSFAGDILRSDLVKVTSVGDRLNKFIDRINGSMSAFAAADPGQDGSVLRQQASAIDNLIAEFASPENEVVAQTNGLLQLSETDSILVKFSEKNFYDPDKFDGEQRYIVAFKENSPRLTIESPNLMDQFADKLTSITAPIKNLSILPHIANIDSAMDSTITYMDNIKTEFKLNKYDDVILDMKEVMAEMKDFNNQLSYRYAKRFGDFVNAIETERKLSVLKPMIEDVLNPMDTLATRIENRDFSDIEKRVSYLGNKVARLDSVVAASKIPSRIKSQIPAFLPTFEQVNPVLTALKGAGTSQEASDLRSASKVIGDETTTLINGVNEKLYMVFNKRHENHGYIENGVKSWEEPK